MVLESVLVWVLVWDQVFRPLALESGQELGLVLVLELGQELVLEWVQE